MKIRETLDGMRYREGKHGTKHIQLMTYELEKNEKTLVKNGKIKHNLTMREKRNKGFQRESTVLVK